MAIVSATMLHEEIWLTRTTYFSAPPTLDMLRFESGFWNEANAEEMFHLRYRFRRGEFADFMLRMDLAVEIGGILTFKFLWAPSRKLIPADFAFMVMLRRLGYPCRFADLVCEFGNSTTYICEAFHIAIDYVYSTYAKGGVCPFIWEDQFP